MEERAGLKRRRFGGQGVGFVQLAPSWVTHVSAVVRLNSRWKYCGGLPIPTCPTYCEGRGFHKRKISVKVR